MKRQLVILLLMFSISFSSFAKKDTEAWKSEKNLSKQYEVFKENLNFWNGSYFMKEPQLEQFYGAMKDSISKLKSDIEDKVNQTVALQNEVYESKNQLEEKQAELDKSIKNQNSLLVFGQYINKGTYTFIVSFIIIGLLVLSGLLFLMFKRSNKITSSLKNEYNELKEEFEVHKKNSLDRYTKMNLELQHTRLKLNKKLTYNERI